MHIKQVIIQGFKSYREQTVVEPFHKGHNVVVGRNGSGKSNFFYAIQFVLSDEFSHLRPEQRQALLHEGTGPKVLTGFVEIIFDNSDSRFPIDREEVFLRRVIGAKKDQYFLNKKMVPRNDVVNLLESAGFSRSNPYYIVKQGKINQMATAPDAHRLKLLREVAGTRVYDERKEESKSILKETEGKKEKIEEFLKTIEDRLKTLEEEKEELKEYQKWDKKRRALEYTIHDRELNDTRKKLDDLENRRKKSGEGSESLRTRLRESEKNAKQASRELKEIRQQVSQAKEEKQTIQLELQQLQQDRTKLENRERDLDEEMSGDKNSKKRAEQELEKLTSTIKQKEEELRRVKPEYEELKKKEEIITKELGLKEQKRKELYAKQGRGSQFTTKDERDKWIASELKMLNKRLKDKAEDIDRLVKELDMDAKKKVELEDDSERMTGEIESYKTNIDDYNKRYYELKKERDQLHSERNELWRKESNLQQSLSLKNEESSKCEGEFRSMAGREIFNGRNSVLQVLETFKNRGGYEHIVKGYHGLVLENIRCDEGTQTACEVTAGKRLYYHIVETDEIGSTILKEFNRQKLPGEVNFMPLNRLMVSNVQYPKDPNVIEMVRVIKYEEKFEKSVRHIFGKTLICRELEAAVKTAKSHRFDCVTLDGDKVMSKGVLTGGYYNTSRSSLEIQKRRSALKLEKDELDKEMSGLKKELYLVEEKIKEIGAEMQKNETKNSKIKDTFDKVKTDIRLSKEKISSIDRSKASKERSLNQLKSNLEALQSTKEGFEAELHQDLLSSLSVADQREVDILTDQIRQLTKENKETFTRRMQKEAEKNKLENTLNNNLMRRREELSQALQEISVEDRKRELDHCKSELKSAESKIKSLEKSVGQAERKLSDSSSKLKGAQEQCERYKAEERECQEKINEDSKDLEKLATKQNTLQQKINDCVKKIRELGSIPAEAFDKFHNTGIKQLYTQLEKANQQLKQYAHVNKKALDQFMSFSDQKEKLVARKEELDVGHDKITELMDHLELRKTEAILFTFRQVTKYFTEVFGKLVPGGHAQLVMQTGNREETELPETEDGGTSLQGFNSDTFTGVGIRVSFSGNQSAEMKEMNQLSGGQKSLVALALIFAIQKCDPAPFYLFDEIDQALDSQHRKAVADMIHELSGDAQFITTTFRPELLENAHKFYGVVFRNKVSHVECVGREQAYDFVEDDQTHG